MEGDEREREYGCVAKCGVERKSRGTRWREDEAAKRRRDEETKRRRDEETKRRRDEETKRRRDEETKRRRGGEAERQRGREAERLGSKEARSAGFGPDNIGHTLGEDAVVMARREWSQVARLTHAPQSSLSAKSRDASSKPGTMRMAVAGPAADSEATEVHPRSVVGRSGRLVTVTAPS
jgi:hypothetical protein